RLRVVGGGGGAAAWFTVSVLPATVSVPLRAVPRFGATSKLSVPVPLPEPERTVSHGALLTADQEQVAVAVIVAVDVPPLPPAETDAGTLYEQLVLLPLSSRSPHAAQSVLLFARESLTSSSRIVWPCQRERSSWPEVQ